MDRFTGEIVQVNVSRGGIPKRPVAKAMVTAHGVEGDGHAHPQFHGGPRQALLWITAECLEELAALGYPLEWGALGENVTTRGIPRTEWRAGQRWRLGPSLVIELTKMRVPCNTLTPYGDGIQKTMFDPQVKKGDASSARWGLSGFYASVVEPGIIAPGDAVTLLG